MVPHHACHLTLLPACPPLVRTCPLPTFIITRRPRLIRSVVCSSPALVTMEEEEGCLLYMALTLCMPVTAFLPAPTACLLPENFLWKNSRAGSFPLRAASRRTHGKEATQHIRYCFLSLLRVPHMLLSLLPKFAFQFALGHWFVLWAPRRYL